MAASLLLLSLLFGSSASDFIWLEGETPTASSAPIDVSSCNFPQLLSSGKWLNLSRKKDQLPPEGLQLTYRFNSKGGLCDAGARVGFEWVRSSFEWKLNDGAWTEAAATKATLDPVRLSTWMEVGWLNLGSATLKQGENTLVIRYKPKEDGSVLAALDAVAFVKPGTKLEGALAPDQPYNQAVDQKAATQTFSMPSFDSARRSSVRLDGAWQVARWDDPAMDTDRYEPVKELPEGGVKWQGIQVPGDAWEKPELVFGSRLIYRTKVLVPTAYKSFFLHFSGTDWIASVFVNGKYMGWHKGTLVPWDIDVTKGILPGKTNEIAVAIKGPYYAMDTQSLLKQRNLPREESFIRYARWVAPIYPSSKGEGDGTMIGLVNPVTLVGTGSAYVSDVFVKPSVATKHIDASLMLTNTTGQARRLQVKSEAIHVGDDKVECDVPTQDVNLDANGKLQVSVSQDWANPRLWWPIRNPDMYLWRTTVLENGSPIDVHEQPFGFREITTDGIKILINGVARNFWNWVDVSGATNPSEWLAKYEAQGDRFHRFARDHVVPGVETFREAQLDWADRNGVPGRLSTCNDGMFITYDLNNPLVWQNYGEHLEQVAMAYRNHPSVIVYSAENEVMYINAQNVGLADAATPKMVDIIKAGMKVDPTKPWIVDGGGSLDGQLPIDCPHYPEGDNQFQPENAYTFFEYADHSKRWPWDRKRPIILGETFFYAGKLEDQAWIGGDVVFRGRQFANLGAAKYIRMLVEGLRWQGVAGICPWVGIESIPGAEKSFSSLAAFTRKRAYRFKAGKANSVQVKVFNDTLSDKPVDLAWTLAVEGNVLANGSQSFTIKPGYGQESTLSINPPATKERQAATLRLQVSQDGVLGFDDTKPVAVLPTVGKLVSRAPVVVFDRSGKIAPWLAAHSIKATALDSMTELETKTGLLLVGPNSLTGEIAYSPAVLAFADRGNPVIVLEQDVPMAGAALPVPIRATSKVGGYAFCQAPTLPVFKNLGAGDFEDWAGDFPTFKHAYRKPSGGARCLVQGGEGLNNALLLEVPAGRGVIVLNQLRIGEKLGVEPAADQLLANLIESYSGFKPAIGKVAIVAPKDASIVKAVEKTAVLQNAADLAKALDANAHKVAIVEATKMNLIALAQNKGRLDQFTNAGGWVMLTGLKPDAIKEFNQLTGIDDQIRPFRVERVTLEHPELVVAATIGNRDLAFYGTQEIQFGDYWLSDRVYKYVVGAQDAAPFMKMPGGPDDPLEYKATYSDNDPYNYVNGLLNSDNWRCIRQLWVPEQGDLTLEFGARRPEMINQINVWNNTNYSTIEKMDIVFDGDASGAMHAVLPDNGNLTEFRLEKPKLVQKSITFVVKSWRRPFVVRDGQTLRLVGIDNVQFLRSEPPKGKIALDNVGGLVAYPHGKGGLLLNQLDFDGGDPNPTNDEKKLRLLTTLLTNLGAGSATGQIVVPGVNAEFSTIDITRWNNTYIRNRDGQRDLFGDGGDLRHLVGGEQVYGDVPFLLSNYMNAPIPQAIGVGFEGKPNDVSGIEVGKLADRIFFLHTARVLRPVQAWEEVDSNVEVARYVVRYADGTTVEVPVRLGEEVANWRQKAPVKPVPNGVVAWAVPYPNAQPDEDVPVLYESSWTNPKPGVKIDRMDVVKGKDGDRAAMVVLAITLARARGYK